MYELCLTLGTCSRSVGKERLSALNGGIHSSHSYNINQILYLGLTLPISYLHTYLQCHYSNVDMLCTPNNLSTSL